MPPSILMNTLDQLFQLVDGWGVSPVVAGGLAVSYWGHPRSTRDIDLAVLVSSNQEFEAKLRKAGLVPSKEPNVAELGFVKVSQWRKPLPDAFIDIDVDFLISESAYHQQAIQRAPKCALPGVKSIMRVLSCEDLLLFKARSGRIIDLADIEVLIELRRGDLDIDYMRAKSAEIGLDPSRWKGSMI